MHGIATINKLNAEASEAQSILDKQGNGVEVLRSGNIPLPDPVAASASGSCGSCGSCGDCDKHASV
jgi:hypothetical protein